MAVTRPQRDACSSAGGGDVVPRHFPKIFFCAAFWTLFFAHERGEGREVVKKDPLRGELVEIWISPPLPLLPRSFGCLGPSGARGQAAVGESPGEGAATGGDNADGGDDDDAHGSGRLLEVSNALRLPGGGGFRAVIFSMGKRR